MTNPTEMSEMSEFATEHDAEAWLDKNWPDQWTTAWSAGPIWADEHGHGITVVEGKTRLEAMNRLIVLVREAIDGGRL